MGTRLRIENHSRLLPLRRAVTAGDLRGLGLSEVDVGIGITDDALVPGNHPVRKLSSGSIKPRYIAKVSDTSAEIVPGRVHLRCL